VQGTGCVLSKLFRVTSRYCVGIITLWVYVLQTRRRSVGGRDRRVSCAAADTEDATAAPLVPVPPTTSRKITVRRPLYTCAPNDSAIMCTSSHRQDSLDIVPSIQISQVVATVRGSEAPQEPASDGATTAGRRRSSLLLNKAIAAAAAVAANAAAVAALSRDADAALLVKGMPSSVWMGMLEGAGLLRGR
jgi:hypothetical protein